MKTKLLLLYGYIIPIATSALVSILPALAGFVSYEAIATFFSDRTELVFAVLALLGAITLPFQSSIINENDPHVLAVLDASKVRVVFVRTSILQAVVIAVFALLILVLSTLPTPFALSGWLELFAASLITFESIALISNGRSYGDIREKIITATGKARHEIPKDIER